MRFVLLIVFIVEVFLFAYCSNGWKDHITELNKEPVIEPDYSGVTIPANIAPLNFQIKDRGDVFRIRIFSEKDLLLTIKSKDGIVKFPLRAWKKILTENMGGEIRIEIWAKENDEHFKFKPLSLFVAREPADPYICYRLIYPGYETYMQMKIIQRNIETFREAPVIENQMLEMNCINCHSFHANDPDKFLVQVRGSAGGTYIFDGDEITRSDLKTGDMKYGAVYPSWHPDGRFIMFSSNNIIQSFHAISDKRIEVRDLASSLIMYDTETNEMIPVIKDDSVRYMNTFPEWSPDGKNLYFCRTEEVYEGYDFKEIQYNLVRRSFNPDSSTFGEADIIFDAQAINKSVSFPKVSPDGKHIVFALHDYGTFPIWHKEADLYLLNLLNGKVERLEINSDDTESYHAWSSNGKWLMFISKRGDGLTARPYFAYFKSDGEWGKPFVLPQKDPTLYTRMLLTFNRPEFLTGRIRISSRDFLGTSKSKALKANWGENR